MPTLSNFKSVVRWHHPPLRRRYPPQSRDFLYKVISLDLSYFDTSKRRGRIIYSRGGKRGGIF